MAEPQPGLKVVPVHPQMGKSLPWPRRGSPGAAGLDVVAAIDAPQQLAPRARVWVPTGIAIELPPNTEAQVRPRSGLAGKFGITCLNTPGTIDADYRGEVKVLLVNFGDDPFTIEPGMRIAQLVVAPVLMVHLQLGEQPLSATERADRGFGSSGL